jgi:DNA-binding winged helix-turn-helix (wHTH) protein
MIEPRRARLGSMVLDFANKMGGEVTELRIGGVVLRVQGRLVQVDDQEPVSLTWREREVLQILVDAGGRVVAKGELLRRVWGPRERDGHLVEVTIGRLRQRLGAASDAVETIYRRGYRISV